MRRFLALAIVAIVLAVAVGSAQEHSSGPYKILKTAKVGGEGNWDYIWADVAGRRLYIPRRAPAAPPGAEGPAPASSVRTRLTIFNLDTLEPAGEIDGIGGNGATVDPKSNHGFTSSKPVSMFDTKAMKLIKTIESSTRRTARFSATSISAAFLSRACPTARERSTSSCRTRRGVSRSSTPKP